MPITYEMELLVPEEVLNEMACPRCGRKMRDHVDPYWRYLTLKSFSDLTLKRKLAVAWECFRTWILRKQVECDIRAEDLAERGLVKLTRIS